MAYPPIIFVRPWKLPEALKLQCQLILGNEFPRLSSGSVCRFMFPTQVGLIQHHVKMGVMLKDENWMILTSSKRTHHVLLKFAGYAGLNRHGAVAHLGKPTRKATHK